MKTCLVTVDCEMEMKSFAEWVRQLNHLITIE